MKSVRLWSIRQSRWLNFVYEGIEATLVLLNPLLKRIGYERLDKPFAAIERTVKGFLFDSQSCGQCTLGSTGMACPMNCPKTLRNGPCGGVRQDGGCEIKPEMTCVWVNAWQGSQQIGNIEDTIKIIQPPVDNRLKGRSAWLRALRLRTGHKA
ncbi:methylenetetrahydrofolate reductase C-terminal domain-containing protein [Luminiphilus sp.]|nr:methylenetetrahydrofolate reductase C-terminal domain-containing protein [Luminiphilus sp.]MDB2643597.1 methylenetetrahydrofolate reductase C-terminal domain-containing protein [Luminiphilus sp.]